MSDSDLSGTPPRVPFSRRSLLKSAAALQTLVWSRALAAQTPISGFTHCVASGDPQQHSVSLWTRYVGPTAEACWLDAEVARDEQFTAIVARSAALARPGADFCAQVRIENLEPGEWYFYRFRAPNGYISPVGRTRTLPDGSLDSFRIGVFSCANATSGWFNGYAHAATRDDLDLLIHLGDYLYEFDLERSDAVPGMAEARGIEPAHEAVTLADYRQRYASYRRDPALQELHRRYPMIALWDDHETVNNSWRNGAKNHDPTTEGPWPARMAAGVQAFHEWLPMRPQPYTSYDIGDLASIFRLETRLLARSQQLDADDWLQGYGGDLQSAAQAFRSGPLADPGRTMMGAVQERWLAEGLAQSVGSGHRWQILAQPIIMARQRMPEDFSSWFAKDSTLATGAMPGLQRGAMMQQLGVPQGMDKWDGYPAARERLFDAAHKSGAELAVLSGDSHNAWAFNLREGKTPIGVEFAVHSVSSLGLDKRLDGDPAHIAASLVEANPDLAWCDTSQRGYAVLDVTPDSISCEWMFIASGEARSTAVQTSYRVSCEWGTRRLDQAASTRLDKT